MHNIEYYTYEENVKRDWVQKELDHVAACEGYQEGSTGLAQAIRWLDNVGICADYDAARQVIKSKDRGWYDQLAVRFYEPVRGFSDKTLEALREKERVALDAYHAKDCIWAKGVKAEFVSCKTCGSKLKRELISSNRCPLCSNDLRPETFIARVKAAESRWKKAQAACNAYVIDHAKKTVRWLVKIEYHT